MPSQRLSSAGLHAGVILAVTQYPEDVRFLKSFFSSLPWRLQVSSTIAGALSYPELEAVKVVLSERDLPDGSWKDLLAAFSGRAAPPRVIVASYHADDSLWAEVLNLGGYDVLAKPLDCGATIRVLERALRHQRENSNAVDEADDDALHA